MRRLIVLIALLLVVSACGNSTEINGKKVTYDELTSMIETKEGEEKALYERLEELEGKIQEYEEQLSEIITEFNENKEKYDQLIEIAEAEEVSSELPKKEGAEKETGKSKDKQEESKKEKEPKKEETKKPEQTKDTNEETLSQKNAVAMAKEYLQYMPFSKSGLMDQLKFEGFNDNDATYAVSNIEVDWRGQAVKMAKDYLDYSSFSRSGLIDQLEFEGFSNADATYAVDEVGL